MSFKICFEYFATAAPPGGIFQFHKNDLLCHLYNFGPKIVILSVSIATKLTISKVHPLIRLRFEQSGHKKSQCEDVLCHYNGK